MLQANAYVGLGSNLGDRAAQLSAAARALADCAGLELVASSRVYETAPVGPPGQGPYLNAVLWLKSELGCRALLELLLGLEIRAGRQRDAGEVRWGPRCLDLDLLLVGDRCVDEVGLQVPHPRLHERAFVLEPLCDLAPDLRHPIMNCSIAELKSQLAESALASEVEAFDVEVWGPAELLAPGR
jgi:2-amino-4-hydroxy-6-hydroxymethyldihydropteridine diphosphokinase